MKYVECGMSPVLQKNMSVPEGSGQSLHQSLVVVTQDAQGSAVAGSPVRREDTGDDDSRDGTFAPDSC